MFWTCCKRENPGETENWTESQNAPKKPVPNSTPGATIAPQLTNTSNQFKNSQNQYNTSNLERMRTFSGTSFSSIKSTQSFYSAKSGDEDFYSVCSENSDKERY